MMHSLQRLWQKPALQGHIGRRMAILIIAFSSAVTLLLSAAQLFSEYRDLRRGLDQQLNEISVQVGTISASAWAFDESQILAALDGIRRLPNIEKATVKLTDTDQVWSVGQIEAQATISRRYPLIAGTSPAEIGSLDVVASLDSVNEQILLHAISILLSNGLKTACVALFMLYLFRRMISLRLAELTRKVRNLGPLLLQSDAALASGPSAVPPTLDEIAAVDWLVERTGEALSRAIKSREAAQAETHASEERFRLLVEQAPEAIFVYDVDNACLVDANPVAEKLLGMSRDELFSEDINRFYSPIQPDGLATKASRQDSIRRAMAGEVINTERKIVTAQGESRICEMVLVRLPTAHGRLLRASLIDITERKQAETNVVNLNLRLQGLLDSAIEVSIIATDPEGSITTFNRGAERLLGYGAEEMLGKSPATFHRESEVKQRARELTRQLGRPISGFETFVAAVREGGSDMRNWTYVRKDGSTLRVSLVVNAVFDQVGQVIGFMGIARDISEQLAAEAKQLRLTIGLDNLVKQRTQALEAALDDLHATQGKLVEAEKLASLGSIVSAIAHELNTPIGNCVTVSSSLHQKTIEFEAQLSSGQLRRSSLDAYLAATREAMALLERGLARSAALVERFKLIAVDQSGYSRRQFELTHLMGSIEALLTERLGTTPYQLRVSLEASLVMDSYPQVIEQVLASFVENSIVHGFAGRDSGTITIRLNSDNGWVFLHFADDGQGMTEHTRKHVFDPFFTTQLGKGGSGLGMYICYNLVTRLLGGTIDVTSEPGQGCRFTIAMPQHGPILTN